MIGDRSALFDWHSSFWHFVSIESPLSKNLDQEPGLKSGLCCSNFCQKLTKHISSEIKLIDLAQLLTFYLLVERPTLASRVPVFLFGHFPTNECEISNFCL